MSIEMITMGLGAMAVMAISLASARKQYNVGVDNMICAAILAVGWGYVFVGETWFPAPPPPPYQPAPFLAGVSVVDAFSAAGVALIAFSRPAWWKFVLLGLLVAELGVELSFWGWALAHGETPHGVLGYRTAMCNVLYTLQLMCVGVAGASHALLGRIPGERGEPGAGRHRRPAPLGSP
jgi:hypothetical protein